jgi:hypothetical protein
MPKRILTAILLIGGAAGLSSTAAADNPGVSSGTAASGGTAASSSAGVAQHRSAARVRTFAALPNWTGIWRSAVWPVDVSGRPPGGEAQLRGLMQLIRQPPYNAEWAARYEAGMKDTAAMAAQDTTLKVCSRSFPALLEGVWMFQVLVLPEETLLVYENGQVRHVYTDDRGHPSGDDLWPTRLGDSIGRWNGDTLRIDTIARKSSEPITPRAWASMLSDSAHFTELLRRVDANTLEDQLTVEDPIALASPWRMTLRFTRVTEMNRLFEFDCAENDRNPVVDGKIITTAAP